MCMYCENHDDYYEGSLLEIEIDLGFGGDEHIWVLVDPDTKDLATVVFNEGTKEQREYHREIYFCPMCGAELKK